MFLSTNLNHLFLFLCCIYLQAATVTLSNLASTSDPLEAVLGPNTSCITTTKLKPETMVTPSDGLPVSR